MIKHIKRLFTGQEEITALHFAVVVVAALLAIGALLGAFFIYYAKYLQK